MKKKGYIFVINLDLTNSGVVIVRQKDVVGNTAVVRISKKELIFCCESINDNLYST